ncbi:MAG: CHASE3 domain-containing protein [Caulobacteraceae bacterium]|nr:CHASE3 domain-containing protein [Caulobacteraceae bacterium]
MPGKREEHGVLYFKRTIAATIALTLTVGALCVFFVYTHVTSLAQSRAWVTHTHAVIETTQDLFTSVQQAAGSERGYVLTGDPAYLSTYDEAIRNIPRREASLAALVADSPRQAASVERLSRAINQRLPAWNAVMAAARAGDMASARAMISRESQGPAASEIRPNLDSIRAVEDRNLQERSAEADRQLDLTLALGLAASFLALFGLSAGAVIMARANRRLSAAIAETRSAEAARAASEALAQAIFAHSPEYLTVTRVEEGGRFVLAEVNPTFIEALGVPATRLRGRPIVQLASPEEADNVLAHYRRVVATGKSVTRRDRITSLPGGPRIWETILAPVHDAAGKVDRIIGSTRDITDRVRAEERLRDAQRMEAVGQLTGGVAHDFNNLLQVIRGNLELLEGAVKADERASRRLKNAIHGADRAAQLTRQLLAFARRQPLAPQVVNLSRLVSEMTDLLRRTLGERIEVETVVAAGLWNTTADPAQVESALLNLALNARDAMPNGGRLTVEITNAVLDEEYARRAEDVAPGQYVMIAVSDTGVGMDEETQARVFEPFFTTKADGKGTGLGLSMVYGFVKQSNGHIQLYSETGHGTTVKIYLPRARQPEASAAPPRAVARPDPFHRRSILVVEDDEAVRAAAVATLEDLGYDHLEAADAESALRIVEQGAPIDLVFSDVVMPGSLRTRDFAARVRELLPHVPILFTSGYTENAIVHHGRLDEGVSLISKPYAKEDLARKIEGMLARRPATAE